MPAPANILNIFSPIPKDNICRILIRAAKSSQIWVQVDALHLEYENRHKK